MIKLFGQTAGQLKPLDIDPAVPLPVEAAVWIDLYQPTREEEQSLEAALGISIPTRADMNEIEASSRFYHEDGALFMTANVLSRPAQGTGDPAQQDVFLSMPVTFILVGAHLVTVRYHEPRSFQMYTNWAERGDAPCANGNSVLLGLFEAIVDRLADIAEEAGTGLDLIGARLFDSLPDDGAPDETLDMLVERIGRAEDLNGKIMASIVTLNRVVTAMSTLPKMDAKRDAKLRLKTLGRDLQSVSDHVERQARRITFLLDSTLGKINIEQTGIIKIFSVMSLVFMPPTLIASIYGMNFDFMPELHWEGAYYVVIVLMIVSSVAPYLYFRKRGWL
ncbi:MULTISPECIES: magnesium transporter CorA family protein [Haematobacter]|nr:MULTISPECIES: magnesium transporter CorA family protein [Haematobacter]